MRLFLFIFINFFLFNLQAASAKFKITWDDEQSGTIHYPADNFSSTPYSISFNNIVFIEERHVYINPDGSETIKDVNKHTINRSCSEHILTMFADNMKHNASKPVYVNQDIATLINNGELIIDKDYTINSDGNVVLIDKELTFIFKAVPENYRQTKVNNISLITYWDTGKQEIIK